TISVPSGALAFNVNGNITISTPITAGGIQLTTVGATAGNISVNANINASGNPIVQGPNRFGVVLNAGGASSNVSNAAGTTITSLGGNVQIISGTGLNLAGSVNAGGNTVQIGPNAAIPVFVLGTGPSGSFNITTLSNITAGGLTFGNILQGGGITLANNWTIPVNLTFLNAGNFTAGANTINVGARTVTINVGGSITAN